MDTKGIQGNQASSVTTTKRWNIKTMMHSRYYIAHSESINSVLPKSTKCGLKIFDSSGAKYVQTFFLVIIPKQFIHLYGSYFVLSIVSNIDIFQFYDDIYRLFTNKQSSFHRRDSTISRFWYLVILQPHSKKSDICMQFFD